MALAVLSMIPAVGSAQVVTPVPEKAAPPAAWTPPPLAPTPPPPPPEADVPTPDIVKRDASGAIIWPERPFELVVLEGVPMEPAQRKAWEEKWTARTAQQDDAVLKSLPKAIQIHDAVTSIESLTELGQLISLADPMKTVSVQPGIETFIKTSQVLKPKQLAAFTDGVKHFRTETTLELNKKVGDDKNKLMILKSRESVTDRSSEAMNALDRMAAALAENWSKVKSGMNLTGDFGAAEAQAAKATDAKSKAAAGIALLKAVPAERQAEVLGTFRTPMPAAPKPPADPAAAGVEMPKAPPAKIPGGVPPTK
jgi:hypothetical protein